MPDHSSAAIETPLSPGGTTGFKLQTERLVEEGGLPPGCVWNVALCLEGAGVFRSEVVVDVHLPNSPGITVVRLDLPAGLRKMPDEPAELHLMARSVADEILWLWRSQDEAHAKRQEIGETFEREAARRGLQSSDCRLRTISPADHEIRSGRRSFATIEFELLHDSMVPIKWTRRWSSGSDVAKFFASKHAYQNALASRRDELSRRGARAAVDRVAVAMLRRAGVEPLRILTQAAATPEGLRVRIGTDELRLHWRMGTLIGRGLLAAGLRWNFGEIAYSQTAIHTRRNPMHSMLVEEIMEAPLIAPDAVVRRVTIDRDTTILLTEPELDHFGIVDGRAVWTE